MSKEKDRSKKIEESAFKQYFVRNQFKYLKLYPYLSTVEKTLKMKDEFNRTRSVETDVEHNN